MPSPYVKWFPRGGSRGGCRRWNSIRIKWIAKYDLIWKKNYKHTPWYHPHPSITFFAPPPQKGASLKFHFFWKLTKFNGPLNILWFGKKCTSIHSGTTPVPPAPLHNIFCPAPPKRGIPEISLFLKIDQIQWAAKYTLIWKKMYKHTLWDHPQHPIAFLPPFPYMGGNY